MIDDSNNISKFFDLSSGVSIRMRRVIESGLRERGLTFAQYGALKALSLQSGMSQAELASALDTDSTTAMVLRTSLEKKGLVARTSDPGDGRIKRIAITDAGRSMLKSSEPGVGSFFSKCEGVASESDLKKAVQVLEKYYTFAGEAVEEAASAKAGQAAEPKARGRKAAQPAEKAGRGSKKRGAAKLAKKAAEPAKAKAAKKAPAKAPGRKAKRS